MHAVVEVPCRVDLAGGLFGLAPALLGCAPAVSVLLSVEPRRRVVVRAADLDAAPACGPACAWTAGTPAGAEEAAARAERLCALALAAEAAAPPHALDGTGLAAATARRLALLAGINALLPGPPLPPGMLPALLARLEQRGHGVPRGAHDALTLLLGGAVAVRSGAAAESAQALPAAAAARLRRWLLLARLPGPAEARWRIARAARSAAAGRRRARALFGELARLGGDALAALLQGDVPAFAGILTREAELRAALAGLAPAAARARDAALAAGALAARPCGGGGGCLLVVVPPRRRAGVARALHAAGAEVIAVRPAAGLAVHVGAGSGGGSRARAGAALTAPAARGSC